MVIRKLLSTLGLVALCLATTTTATAQQQKSRGYVVDFSASWCGPCQQMAPMVERLARQGYPILSIDVDQRPDLKRKYRITSLPTFVLFVDGKEQKRQVGAMPESEVKRMLAAIPKPKPASSAPPQMLAENSQRSAATSPIAKTKSALLDLIPGRKRAEPAPLSNETVIRANTDDRVPAMPIARGPMASSVRIQVRVNDQLNYGSGTIIDSSPGRATIATCWHIFRGAKRDTKIEVDTFFTGKTETYVAKVVALDEAADVGLIEVSADSEWPTVKVASTESAPRVDESVISIGCGGGQDPTRQSIRVTRLDPYNGPSNTECSGVPIRGRSGGGLFNARGELIGVCSAADKQDKRGIYAGLAAIHDMLDRTQMAHLYRGGQPLSSSIASLSEPPSRPTGFPTDPIAVPATDNRFEMTSGGDRSRSSEPSVDDFLAGNVTAPSTPPASPPAWPSTPERTADSRQPPTNTTPPTRPFAEFGAPAAPPATAPAAPAASGNDDVEIVCVIRSKSNPELGSRVIVIDQSDPRLLELLREYDRRSQKR